MNVPSLQTSSQRPQKHVSLSLCKLLWLFFLRAVFRKTALLCPGFLSFFLFFFEKWSYIFDLTQLKYRHLSTFSTLATMPHTDQHRPTNTDQHRQTSTDPHTQTHTDQLRTPTAAAPSAGYLPAAASCVSRSQSFNDVRMSRITSSQSQSQFPTAGNWDWGSRRDNDSWAGLSSGEEEEKGREEEDEKEEEEEEER